MGEPGRVRGIAVVAVIASIVGGCATVTPTPASPTAASSIPEPVATVAPSTAAVAEARPWPSVTVPALITSTEATTDGLRVSLTVDQLPLRPGQETWATMTVTNESDHVVEYMTDGCMIAIHAFAWLGGVWTSGKAQTGIAAIAKTRALEANNLGATLFADEFVAGRDVGCADVAITHRFEPGDHLTRRAVWQPFQHVPTPDLPAEIVASFPHDDDPAQDAPPPAEVRLATAVLGGERWAWLTPAEAVDIAVADPELLAWLERVPIAEWVGPTLTFDRDARTWAIDVVQESDRRIAAHVVMDASTGAFVQRRFA
jgi:hypothetical protein